MPKKKLDEELNINKKSSSTEKKVVSSNKQDYNKFEITSNKKENSKKTDTKTKKIIKKVLQKPKAKKELPKPEDIISLPKGKETKNLPAAKEKKGLPGVKEKKILPKVNEKKLFPKLKKKKALSEEISDEEKDLKLLEKIKEFFSSNPDKTISIDDKVEQENYMPEYYDLPYRYNETVVKILAQTPKRLFIYWDIADSDIEKYKKAFGKDFFERTYPVLLVHNEELNYTYEVPINDFANSWYLDIKDSKSKYTVQLGRKFKERPHIEDETEQIIIEENIHLYNDYIEIVSSNTLEAPNDHVLFENLTSSIVYRNVKTKEENTKDITTLLNGLAKVYNIHDLYNFIYKDQMNESIFDLNNPGSAGNPSSSITSSMFK